MEAADCQLTEERIHKVHSINEVGWYPVIKLDEVLMICATASMNPEHIVLSEINQAQNDKHCLLPLEQT